jgi:hypothetical protein
MIVRLARGPNVVAQRTFCKTIRGCMGGLAAFCVLASSVAQANASFSFDDEPIHPGCVHALSMRDGDSHPVTTAISLRGCASSSRSKAPITRGPDGGLSIEDETHLGKGRFGYQHLSTLKNGIFIVGVLRTTPAGATRTSIAALELVKRPMLLRGEIVDTTLLEMIGEVWIKDIEFGSLRTVGNAVHFSAGVGPGRRQQSIDLGRIKNARK